MRRRLVRWLAVRAGLIVVDDTPPDGAWVAVTPFPVVIGDDLVLIDGIRVRRAR